jgi:hypothetical protein
MNKENGDLRVAVLLPYPHPVEKVVKRVEPPENAQVTHSK